MPGITYTLAWLVWLSLLATLSWWDLCRQHFPLGLVLYFGAWTLGLDPNALGDLLIYFGLFSGIKHITALYRPESIGWGDVEVLSILASQSTHLGYFLMASGILGMGVCLMARLRGLPFVPIMAVAWLSCEGVLKGIAHLESTDTSATVFTAT